MSKVFEKAVLERIWVFLEKNNIIYGDQHGFVKNKSTTSAIFSFTNKVVRELDSKNHSLGLFFDLSKAFDTVDHDRLLCKLENMGIRGLPLDWFSSYLRGRSQYVEILAADGTGCLRRHKSSEVMVTKGVPQGSVLGPILFLLYINDLSSSTRNAGICLFADDTSLSLSSPSLQSLELLTFIEANKLVQWFDENLLKTNSDKTQLLNFSISNRSIDPSLPILIDQTLIQPSDTVKFLGILLDKHLNFHQHIDLVIRKVSVGLFVLRTLAKYTSTEVLLSAYYGLIYPFLSYALPVWGAENKRTFFIFKMQKQAVRIIFSLHRQQTCRDVFRASGILTFPSLYILETLSFVTKNLHKFKEYNSNSYPRRHINNCNIPRHSTSFFQHHLLYNGVKLFNSLPHHLKQESNHSTFRRQLKSLLVQRTCYSVRDFLTGGQS